MKIISFLLILSIYVISTPFADTARTQTTPTFKIETLVSNGSKSKEEKSRLSFSESSFKTAYEKNGAIIKEFNYADIKTADYSFSKKPLLSTGGAIAMVILTGLLVLPFLFMKKKQHWLSIRTENDYVVMKLDNDNFRQIIKEFEIRKVTVNTINEDESDNKKDKDKDKIDKNRKAT